MKNKIKLFIFNKLMNIFYKFYVVFYEYYNYFRINWWNLKREEDSAIKKQIRHEYERKTKEVKNEI